MFDELPLLANAAIFAAAAAAVWFAGTRLAGYADAIAERTGIGRAALGLLLLGGITSLPEIAVAITASLSGNPALSVAGVLGSAAINVLILAVADAAIGRDALSSTPASARVMLQGLLGIVLFAIVIGAVIAGDTLLLGMGVSSWALLVAYAIALRMLVRSQEYRAWVPKRAFQSVHPAAPETDNAAAAQRVAWPTIAAAAVILVAGYLLAEAGAALADQTGLGTSFVGGVFLAFATSLPEISTVLGAVRLRLYEMAIADIFGTNLFNVVVIVLTDALHSGPPVLVEVGAFAGFGALLAMLMTAIFLIGMVERRDRTVLRMGFDSLSAIVVYAGGLVVMYQLR